MTGQSVAAVPFPSYSDVASLEGERIIALRAGEITEISARLGASPFARCAIATTTLVCMRSTVVCVEREMCNAG